MDFLSEYDFVHDAINMRVHRMHASSIRMYVSYLKDRNLEAKKSY
jgi:hypothetical protein